MKAEIIAVGTELLLGDVVNTNAAWLSKVLSAIGVDVYHHVTVGDNPARIHGVMRQALSRADRPDVLLFTGGLGPTPDDLTVAAIADFFGAPLVMDDTSAEAIQRYFIARNHPISHGTLKQALRPETAQVLANPQGTAPGILWEVDYAGKPVIIITFPGVPKELYAMWPGAEAYLRDRQQARGENGSVLAVRFLHFFGVGESRLAEALSDLMDQADPTVAPYVGQAEVRIRLVTRGETLAAAEARLDPVEAEIRRRVGEYCIGTQSLPETVIQTLTERGQTLAVAESCTGGFISHRLTNVPGSSAVVGLNMVTYANAAKTRQLGVDAALFDTVGAVSAQVAGQMAEGIASIAQADVGLAISGIAGPSGGTPEKPVGTAYIGVHAQGRTETLLVNVNPQYDRETLKLWFSQYALNAVLRML